MDSIDKSQYQTPRTVYNEELYSHIEKSAPLKTPEKLNAPFQFVKDVEAFIDSARDTAEALEQKHGREMKVPRTNITFVRSAREHSLFDKQQKDVERELTVNTLFAEKNRFGVHYSSGKDVPNSPPEAGHWYVEEMVNGVFDGSKVTHIETYAHAVYMFDHQGRHVPMNIANLEIFAPMVKHYPGAVIDAYPFDRDRADILLDSIDFPDDISQLLPPAQPEAKKSDYDRAA